MFDNVIFLIKRSQFSAKFTKINTAFFLFLVLVQLHSSFALFKQNKSHLYKMSVTVDFLISGEQ